MQIKITKKYLMVFGIFIFGFVVRLLSVLPYNTIIGFDQARDLFSATTIFRDHNLAIIGPTAGNNPNLHHGILFIYYLIPGLVLFNGNPIGAVIFNSFFNSLSVFVIYLLGKEMFNRKVGLIAAIISAISFYFVQFSGWLSNPTGTFITLPIFFYGLWKYYKGKSWGLVLAAFFLGLTIQFELFFVYLIPTTIIIYFALKPKLPNFKLLLISIFAFMFATASMIATEIKYNFGGIKALLNAGELVGGEKKSFFEIFINFLQEKWETFYLNIWPQEKEIGSVIGILAVLYLIYKIIRIQKVEDRKPIIFLLIWFFSPAIMFLLGQHNAPWFFIGRPAAAILIAAYLISKLNNFLITAVLIFIISVNLMAIKDSYGKGQELLGPDKAGLMVDQIKAIDYTYKSSVGENFQINTLTNPLYVNAVWGYQYYWYGRNNYRYLPTFAGGDQLFPYNSLQKPSGSEKYLYLLIDTTNRIPPQYRKEMLNWADNISNLEETRFFGGIEVQKRFLKMRNL